MSGFTRAVMHDVRNHLVYTMLDHGYGTKYADVLTEVGVRDLGDLVCVEYCYFDDVCVKTTVNEKDKQLVLDLVKWLRMKWDASKERLTVDEWYSLDATEFYDFISKPQATCFYIFFTLLAMC